MVSQPITYLIDNNEIDCLIAKKVLGIISPKDEVITFYSPEEALKTLNNLDRNSYPTQILLDLWMPKIDGWQFLEAYTALPNYPFNHCKIIILTSSINSIDRQKANQYECITDYISKPFSEQII